jgi:hypothetical protein
MSKSIQDALDLPTIENLLKSNADEVATVTADTEDTALCDAIAAGGITPEMADEREAKDHSDSMDNIYDEALQHAKDLMDLGYNVDTRSAGRIFENSANMFKIAIEAKNSKRKAQLDTIKSKQEQQKINIIERRSKGENDQTDGSIDTGSVIVEDRNELIRRLRGEATDDK